MNLESKITFVMLWHISERKGGAEVQAGFLAEELHTRGFDVSYICQTNQKDKINTVEVINGIEVHFLKSEKKFLWLNCNNYIKVLKNINPDILVQRNSSPILMSSKRYKASSNAKLIWICTDNLAPFKDFMTKRFKMRNDRKELGNIKYLTYFFSAIISDKLRNSAMKSVDLAFSQNQFQKSNIKANFDLDSHKMISGHPLPKDIKENLNLKNKKSILWCANWGKHKRPELFIDLARQMSNSDYEFIMIGGHSNKSYVSKLLEDRPKNLKVTGQLLFEDALSYFNQASLFVNSSTQDGDGFPNTFIQSWLRGVPVLTFGFNPDQIITENNLGYVVKTTQEAKETCSMILENDSAYQKLSKNVVDYANKKHTIKVMTDHFVNTLSENL